MRKVYIKLETMLMINVEEGIEISEVINDMDYEITLQTENSELLNLKLLTLNNLKQIKSLWK